MKKLLASLLVAASLGLGLATGAQASSGPAIAWDKAPANTNDNAALQRGAKLFVNYCLNCHSAAFMRYNRLKDIGLSEQQIKERLQEEGERLKRAGEGSEGERDDTEDKEAKSRVRRSPDAHHDRERRQRLQSKRIILTNPLQSHSRPPATTHTHPPLHLSACLSCVFFSLRPHWMKIFHF